MRSEGAAIENSLDRQAEMRHHLRLQDVLPLGSIRQTWRAPGGTIFKPRRVKVLKPFTSAHHYTLQFIRRHVIRRHDGLEGYPHPYSLNKVLVFNCLETWRALKPSRQTASPQNPLWKVLRQGFQRHAGLLVRFDSASSFTLFHCAPRKGNYLQKLPQ